MHASCKILTLHIKFIRVTESETFQWGINSLWVMPIIVCMKGINLIIDGPSSLENWLNYKFVF